MMRDEQRRQVYAAEDLAGEGTALSEPRTVEFLTRSTEALCRGRWWRVDLGCGAVDIALNRSEQRSYFSPLTRVISLSPQACDLGTLTHELAHAAAFDTDGYEPLHGPHFRTLHVQVRRAMLGTRCAADLLAVYRQFGLATMNAQSVVPSGSVLPTELYLQERIAGRPPGHHTSRRPGPPIAL
ncbi:MAG: hypothetical protein HKN24_06980 [Acidimicrobiales bacterium]|nr:hypothetical protein [Acidimicrobiales bacterium]